MSFVLREEGQGLVEYGLILVFVGVVVAAALAFFGDELAHLFSRVAEAFP